MSSEQEKHATGRDGNGAKTAGEGRIRVEERIVEIVSDSGEGAQKAGQSFGAVCAKMGNGVWTVEIIPAEIKPPARSRAGASGIRVRFGSKPVTNMGDAADIVVAFNEQVLYGRMANHAFKKGTHILLENKWKDDPQEEIRKAYATALEDFAKEGLIVHEFPLEKLCQEIIPDARVGKNMFVLGVLCEIFNRDMEKAIDEIRHIFAKKGEKVIELNRRLIEAGYRHAAESISFKYDVPSQPTTTPQIVMNGNQAVGLGVMASGMEVVAMYPITPATSASHYLAEAFHHMGGCLHQAEDEIAAVGFAIGSSFAGRTACTITSGPGLALKTEFIGLASMAEIPLVLVNVQRGGPSTGLPTKVEQGDLMASLFGTPGDAPKIVLAASTIEECFHFVILARKLAEAFRMPVILLTDANLATGVSPFPRPKIDPAQMAPPIDQSPWEEGVAPYDWDEKTGLSPRPVPGQRGGEYTLTGLAHTRWSKVAYDPLSNQKACDMRSRKLAVLRETLKPPKVFGEPEGDLLVVGWGSTEGTIQEAVARVQAGGHKVSSVHLRFLQPLEPGLREIFNRFKNVFTVELNYSDDPDLPHINPGSRRRAQLSRILRQHTLLDIDCWSMVEGQPLPPGRVEAEILRRIALIKEGEPACSV